MKQNIWKILAIVFFAVSLIEFILGYFHIKNIKESNFVRIKKMEAESDSIITFHKIIENISDTSVQNSIKKSTTLIRNFEAISGNNFLRNVILINGVPKLVSATGKEFDLKIMMSILEKVTVGNIFGGSAIDNVSHSLPNNLADGSEFREPIRKELRALSAYVKQNHPNGN
jgi:type III secretory pathway component EscU